MMREFEAIRRLDYCVADAKADPRLSFDNLFSAGRGNMFGVLECEDEAGETVVLRAFSSLWDGIRQIEGWVSPILSAAEYEGMILPSQREIKALTAEMAELSADSSAFESRKSRRKLISQGLWKDMCAAYHFSNFRGEVRPLSEAILPGTPIPGGIGECCAPKLLNHAARNGLRPLGLSEFYWTDRADGAGQGNQRMRGHFYPSCEARCRPILGFMLCGFDE